MHVPTKSTSVIPAIKAKSDNVRASDSSRPSDSNLNGGISAIVMMVKAFSKIAEKLSSGLPKQLHKAKLVRDGVWVGLYEQRQGCQQDLAQAKEYYRKVCDAGDQDGCNDYKRLNSATKQERIWEFF